MRMMTETLFGRDAEPLEAARDVALGVWVFGLVLGLLHLPGF